MKLIIIVVFSLILMGVDGCDNPPLQSLCKIDRHQNRCWISQEQNLGLNVCVNREVNPQLVGYYCLNRQDLDRVVDKLLWCKENCE